MTERVDGLVENEPFLVQIETPADTFAYDCGADDTILGAGLAAGYTLPYECATGTCGTCRGRVVDGSVDPGWTAAPGYARLKRDKGDVLMCQARPRGPCVLRVPTNAKQPEAPTPIRFRHRGRVAAVRPLTRDVIELELVLSRPVTFRAGQFVTLRRASIEGGRAYSMANYEEESARLTFVVNRKPGGFFSDLIFKGDIGGGDFEVLGPLGRATFRPEEGRDLLCIAGGSGIAGMMAMLRHATAARYFAEGHRGNVFFGVRTLQDAFYLDRLAAHVVAGQGALDVTLAVSDEQDVPSRHPEFPLIRLASGLVHEVAAASLSDTSTSETFQNATAFVAGPKPMVDAAVAMLIRRGLGVQNIRFDKFS